MNKTDGKKRLAILLPSLVVGGSTILVLNLLNLFVKDDDFEVRLFVFFDEKEAKYGQLINDNNDKILFLGKRKKIDFKFLRRLRKGLDEFRPDIVSTHLTSIAHLSMAYLMRRFPFCVFHTVHSLPSKDLPALYRLLVRKRIKKRQIQFIGVSKKIFDETIRVYKLRNDECAFVPNGIFLPSDYDPTPIAERCYDFLCVGRFSKCKNFPDLIRAFKIVNDGVEKHSLCLCGYGEEEEKIKALIYELGLQKYVLLFGKETPVAHLYERSKIFCLFSSYEGNPITILEAESFGLPIIATDVGGVSETVINNVNGILIQKSGDIEAESNAMKRLIDSKELAQRMSLESYAIAKNHSIESTKEKYKAVFLKRGKD